jgi:hypothetical protein
MRNLFFLFLIFLFSCAHHDGPYRTPSSFAELIFYGDPDPMKSSVKVFPPKHEEKKTIHYYYLELKDSRGKYVDRDPHEFQVKVKKTVREIKVERVLRGRYYVILEANHSLSARYLDFYVAGLKLRESFQVGIKPPHPSKTRIRKLAARRERAKFELVLKDVKGHFVETPEDPEIIVESDATLEKLEHMGNGIWQITMTYPRRNQLFYISVRCNGIYFKNLFRFQYIDSE